MNIYFTKDLDIADLDNPGWDASDEAAIGTYWSGKDAPEARHFSARMLWSPTALFVRFDARQGEELVIDDKPDLSRKTMGLWNRDVCEIFIAPDRANRNRYLEFEIAPTGEWIDLEIENTRAGRVTNWDYKSNMESAARIEADRVIMAIKIPFESLGVTPKAGDTWLGNLCRCVGKDPRRGYLAWRPTMTEKPSFHVPEAFGEFCFVK